MVELARWLDRQPRQLYAVYDYWHTSPNFFLIRVGMLLMILCGAYIWCRWVIGKWLAGPWGFSPLIQLGQASLLVYWVHIEFVYGRVSILPKHADSIRTASVGLLIITLAMVALAYARTKAKGRPSDLLSWLRQPPGASKLEDCQARTLTTKDTKLHEGKSRPIKTSFVILRVLCAFNGSGSARQQGVNPDCRANSTTSRSAHRPSSAASPLLSPINAQCPPSVVSTNVIFGFAAIRRRVSACMRINGSFAA